MHSDPEFWSGDDGYVDFERKRFLAYTEENIKEGFKALDQSTINKLKSLPTLFAVEDESAYTRIGKINHIEVEPKNLRIYYSFDEKYPPLPKGTLRSNGIGNFEMHRRHWAIKEGDIYDFIASLTKIAIKLRNANKNVQLIYAFNGSGKTRLSAEFKELIVPKERHDPELAGDNLKVLYYNAFTEDLFYWDNDLDGDIERKLKIHPNKYTDWVLKEQGQDQNAISHFQRYANDKLTPNFNDDFSEITFSLERGGDNNLENLKISKGEESNFIWSIFYSLLEEIISVRNDNQNNVVDSSPFSNLEYVFIDDPVSSLDENHLIELAVNLAMLIKSDKTNLKFIITTHNSTFYNVLYSELDVQHGYLLEKHEDGTFSLIQKQGRNNHAFSYHLHLKNIIKKAIDNDQVEKYHIMLLRNLYEKTASFLGYRHWKDLLPDSNKDYLYRIIQFTSHAALPEAQSTGEQTTEKEDVEFLLNNLNNYGYWKDEGEQNAPAH